MTKEKIHYLMEIFKFHIISTNTGGCREGMR